MYYTKTTPNFIPRQAANFKAKKKKKKNQTYLIKCGVKVMGSHVSVASCERLEKSFRLLPSSSSSSSSSCPPLLTAPPLPL
jgi:hypothetical protein